MDKRLVNLYHALEEVKQMYLRQDQLMLRTNTGIEMERSCTEKHFVNDVRIMQGLMADLAAEEDE